MDPSCEFMGDQAGKCHDWVVWVVVWNTQFQTDTVIYEFQKLTGARADISFTYQYWERERWRVAWSILVNLNLLLTVVTLIKTYTLRKRERETVAQLGSTSTCANCCLVLVSLINTSAYYCAFYSDMACTGTQDNKR